MTPSQEAHEGYPLLPEPAMEDVPSELWGQNVTYPALYTAEQMRSYVDADRKARQQEALDARRYRWLRERDVWTTAYGGVKWCMELRQAPATIGQPFHSGTYGTHLDAAVDAAIAKGEQP